MDGTFRPPVAPRQPDGGNYRIDIKAHAFCQTSYTTYRRMPGLIKPSEEHIRIPLVCDLPELLHSSICFGGSRILVQGRRQLPSLSVAQLPGGAARQPPKPSLGSAPHEPWCKGVGWPYIFRAVDSRRMHIRSQQEYEPSNPAAAGSPPSWAGPRHRVLGRPPVLAHRHP